MYSPAVTTVQGYTFMAYRAYQYCNSARQLTLLVQDQG
jgi:hypothetical protein